MLALSHMTFKEHWLPGSTPCSATVIEENLPRYHLKPAYTVGLSVEDLPKYTISKLHLTHTDINAVPNGALHDMGHLLPSICLIT